MESHWLLNQPLDVLGFEDISVAGWTVETFLGAGATSAVFSAKRAGNGEIAVSTVRARSAPSNCYVETLESRQLSMAHRTALRQRDRFS